MRWPVLLLFIYQASSFAITPVLVGREEILTATISTSSPITPSAVVHTTTTTSITVTQHQLPLSALVTIAPLLPNPLERRQRCFNDQGFSVDCATWTGYYYTWGPPGNPYLGGPGEGGGGSGGNGGGGGTVVVYSNEGYLGLVNLPAILGVMCLTLLLFI
ncbi:uncharacterized protein A1O9_08140 [Exophiala aquamarina CBS 119918]|uniref:Uncharacterized protein n=1 Tax=Exophiala aquamarina CBS 119918 TaxID=1182545 RepID=A0A072PIQ5_9EURO|nr:uncharacterized protein A1O9_08140 [Exophiala aquamarina CBS 119918]KEF55390.1 hypothetical protein A1O9_08140 [Exophiala aquamarina CBS 119918]